MGRRMRLNRRRFRDRLLQLLVFPNHNHGVHVVRPRWRQNPKLTRLWLKLRQARRKVELELTVECANHTYPGVFEYVGSSQSQTLAVPFWIRLSQIVQQQLMEFL
jgi:hypothetical protein